MLGPTARRMHALARVDIEQRLGLTEPFFDPGASTKPNVRGGTLKVTQYDAVDGSR